MFRAWRKTFWRPWRRRICAGVTLLAQLAATFGLPLPAGRAVDAEGEPFPCQGRGCGCRNAEQCAKGCCCFTEAERLAWYQAHDRTPPAPAEAPPRSWRSPRQRDRPAGKTQPPACCQECAAHPGKGGVGEKSPPGDQRAPPNPSPDGDPPSPPPGEPKEGGQTPKSGTTWLPGFSALKCRGLLAQWAEAGAALPVGPPLVWSPCRSPAGWLAYAPDGADAVPSCPPDPPPRPSRCS